MPLDKWQRARVQMLIPHLGHQYASSHPWREGPPVHMAESPNFTGCGLPLVRVGEREPSVTFDNRLNQRTRQQAIRVTKDLRRVTCMRCMAPQRTHKSIKWLLRWWRRGAHEVCPLTIRTDAECLLEFFKEEAAKNG